MRTVNMHEAKTHLSKLVEGAVQGEPFVIARAGKPLVKVVAVEERVPSRFGFMKGHEVKVPDDFDTMFAEEIRAMFEDGPIWPEGYDENGPLPDAAADEAGADK